MNVPAEIEKNIHIKESSSNYLKKKKMYEMLQSLVDDNLDLMKNASYRFYCGSEWLECASDYTVHFKNYELYHKGNFFSLDISQYDEEKDKYVEIERITYQMINGQLVKQYQRTKAYKEVEETKKWIESHKLI